MQKKMRNKSFINGFVVTKLKLCTYKATIHQKKKCTFVHIHSPNYYAQF